jgi:hypothetical protein
VVALELRGQNAGAVPGSGVHSCKGGENDLRVGAVTVPVCCMGWKIPSTFPMKREFVTHADALANREEEDLCLAMRRGFLRLL